MIEYELYLLSPRERIEVRGPKIFHNHFDDHMNIFLQFMIFKMQNAMPAFLQKLFSFLIISNLQCMDSAIKLDNEVRFSTKEINDVATDGNLSAKFVIAELPVLQFFPEQLLHRRLLFAKSPCEYNVLFHGRFILPLTLTLSL